LDPQKQRKQQLPLHARPAMAAKMETTRADTDTTTGHSMIARECGAFCVASTLLHVFGSLLQHP
jgi:hypothetical protein